MTEWINLKERKPNAIEVCDFLFQAKPDELPWMMCHGQRRDVKDYIDSQEIDDGLVWWRPAQELPDDAIR